MWASQFVLLKHDVLRSQLGRTAQLIECSVVRTRLEYRAVLRLTARRRPTFTELDQFQAGKRTFANDDAGNTKGKETRFGIAYPRFIRS